MARQLGKCFNYTHYFAKRRKRFSNKRKQDTKDFIAQLEMAILVAIKMTGGDAGKMLTMNRNKLCNICQSHVLKSYQESTVYFKAKKVIRTDDFSSDQGFSLDWVHEKSNCAEALGPLEWLSGPLLLCSHCLKTMHWYEEHIHWIQIRSAVEKRDLKELPPIFGLYSSLEKSLRLAEFFGLQIAESLRDPFASSKDLNELKRCISNNCNVIKVIGKQIRVLGLEDQHQNNRELALQKAIAHYCSHVVNELNCLFAIDQEKSNVTINITPNDEPNEVSRTVNIIQNIWAGISFMFCRSEHSLQLSISQQEEPPAKSNNNTVYYDKNK